MHQYVCNGPSRVLGPVRLWLCWTLIAVLAPQQSNAQAQSPTQETVDIPVPKIVALTWQKGDRGKERFSDIPLWRPDGSLLSDDEAARLKKEIRATQIQSMRQKQSIPLIVIFDVGTQLPQGTRGVQVSCEFEAGRPTSGGTYQNRILSKTDSSRMLSVTSATMFVRNESTFDWPETATLNLKYPVEELVLEKTVDSYPEKPIGLARGVTWGVEPKTGYQPGEGGERYPAGVLEISKSALDLVQYDVRVFVKGKARHLRESYVTNREREGQLFEIRVSERFPTREEFDRVEIYRRRYRRQSIYDVRLRTDLLPKEAEEPTKS